jgi:hypothetical protein
MKSVSATLERADSWLDYAAFWILPLRMQDVQTRSLFAPPFTTAFTD